MFVNIHVHVHYVYSLYAVLFEDVHVHVFLYIPKAFIIYIILLYIVSY